MLAGGSRKIDFSGFFKKLLLDFLRHSKNVKKKYNKYINIIRLRYIKEIAKSTAEGQKMAGARAALHLVPPGIPERCAAALLRVQCLRAGPYVPSSAYGVAGAVQCGPSNACCVPLAGAAGVGVGHQPRRVRSRPRRPTRAIHARGLVLPAVSQRCRHGACGAVVLLHARRQRLLLPPYRCTKTRTQHTHTTQAGVLRAHEY